MKRTRKSAPLLIVLAAFFSLFLLTALPVHAAGGLSISTPFPGTTVTAGKTASFSLTLDNATAIPMNAAVSVSGVPDGWTAQLLGNSNQVSRVFVRANNSATVQLSIVIPPDAKEGDYNMEVTANAEGIASDTLALTLTVSKKDVTQGSFTSQFPELQGGATTSFTFNASLTNNGSEDRYYSLTANAPDGWQVTFQPTGASASVASMTIPAGQSQSLSIAVKPPADVKAGDYKIPITAVSTAESASLDLTVTITGNYSMTLATKDGTLNASAQVGKKTPVSLVLTNTGSVDLTAVALTSTTPTDGWAISFDNAKIDSLAAGASQDIVAYIQPDAKAVTGDYPATITATAGSTKANLDLRVAVKTSTMWGIIAVVIIVVLVGGLYLVFRKFGRR